MVLPFSSKTVGILTREAAACSWHRSAVTRWPQWLHFELAHLLLPLPSPLFSQSRTKRAGRAGKGPPQRAPLTLPSSAPSMPPSCHPPAASSPSPLCSLAFEIGRRHQLCSDDEKRGRSTCSCLGLGFRAVLVLNTYTLIWVLRCRRVGGGLLFSC